VTNLLGMLLEGWHEVFRAASGEEALEAAHAIPGRNHPGVRPGIESLETCRRLRRVTDAVIPWQGRGERVSGPGLQLGADDYRKPYTYGFRLETESG
jgi:DNA-binding response OmpR family regulator